MPAPEGNKNATRHGLTAGALPKGGGYVARATGQLRRAIEQATLEVRGRIGVYEAAVIQSTIRWERHAMLAQRWLKKHYDDLDLDQRLNFSREIARASESRDRCLKALGLDRYGEEGDGFSRLYATPVDVESAVPDQDARNGHPQAGGPASGTEA